MGFSKKVKKQIELTDKAGKKLLASVPEIGLLQDRMTEIQIFRAGLKEGLKLYAWWNDGTQWVGTCGGTLKRALDDVDKGKFDFILDGVKSARKERLSDGSS